MNVWDILILCAVGLALGLSIRHLYKNRGTGCGGQCAGCTRACARRKE